MKRVNLTKWIPILTVAAFLLLIPNISHAESIAMPWDTFLTNVADTLTGKTALTLATIGIAICGIGLFLGNGGDGFRKFLIVIIGLCIVVYAAKFVTMISDNATSTSNDKVGYTTNYYIDQA